MKQKLKAGDVVVIEHAPIFVGEIGIVAYFLYNKPEWMYIEIGSMEPYTALLLINPSYTTKIGKL